MTSIESKYPRVFAPFVTPLINTSCANSFACRNDRSHSHLLLRGIIQAPPHADPMELFNVEIAVAIRIYCYSATWWRHRVATLGRNSRSYSHLLLLVARLQAGWSPDRRNSRSYSHLLLLACVIVPCFC